MGKESYRDMTSCVTTVLSGPVDAVWPALLEQAQWMTEFRIEMVSGTRNQEGEIKKVMHLESDPAWVDFYFKTLSVLPYRRFIYKAYTESRAGPYGFTGIEMLTLNAHGRETSVTFEAYLELVSDSMRAKDFEKFVEEATAGSMEMWRRNFARLQALISARPR